MTTRTFGALMTLLVVAATTAGAAGQKVSHDFDKSADFGALKTFAFKVGTPSGNPLVDDRITAAIATALAARGMTHVDTAPDAYIVTHLTFDKEKDITTFSNGYGPYGWGWGGGWGATAVRIHDILMGTLVIDVIDAAKGAVVWRGIGVKEVKQQPKPSKVDRNVTSVVAKILKNFPPTARTS
jgi:uncharacterized protein DUF4136